MPPPAKARCLPLLLAARSPRQFLFVIGARRFRQTQLRDAVWPYCARAARTSTHATACLPLLMQTAAVFALPHRCRLCHRLCPPPRRIPSYMRTLTHTAYLCARGGATHHSSISNERGGGMAGVRGIFWFCYPAIASTRRRAVVTQHRARRVDQRPHE